MLKKVSMFLGLWLAPLALSQIIVPISMPAEFQNKYSTVNAGSVINLSSFGGQQPSCLFTTSYQQTEGGLAGMVKPLLCSGDPVLTGKGIGHRIWAGKKALYFSTYCPQLEESCESWKLGNDSAKPEKLVGTGDVVSCRLVDGQVKKGKVVNRTPWVFPSHNGEREIVYLFLEESVSSSTGHPSSFHGIFEKRGELYEQIVQPQTLGHQIWVSQGLWLNSSNDLFYGELGAVNSRLVKYNLRTKTTDTIIERSQIFLGDKVDWWSMFPDLDTYDPFITYRSGSKYVLVSLAGGKPRVIYSTEQEMDRFGKPKAIVGMAANDTLGIMRLRVFLDVPPEHTEPATYRGYDALAFWDRETNTRSALIGTKEIAPDGKIVERMAGVEVNVQKCQADFFTFTSRGEFTGWYAILKPCLLDALPSSVEAGKEIRLRGQNLFIAGYPTTLLVNNFTTPFIKTAGGGIAFAAPNQPGEYKVRVRVGTHAISNPVTITVLGPPPPPPPAFTAQGVVNGATFLSGISPGALASIFGANLAAKEVRAESLPLPTTLGGVQVTFDGHPAPLWYVSPTQINLQVPLELGAPADIRIQVSRDGVKSAVVIAPLIQTSPGVFHRDGIGIATHADYRLATPSDPLRPGEPGILWTTGLGPTDPPAKTGQAAPRLAVVINPVNLVIGGQEANILFVGLTEGLVGLYQINFVVPPQPASNEAVLIVAGQECRFKISVRNAER